MSPLVEAKQLEEAVVRYSGRVQGVGFRMTSLELAQKLPVVGQVRNIRDGTVELIAQGEPTAIQELLQSISQRMGRNIVDQAARWRSIEALEFDSFQIAANA